jgi:hypothetical protein
MSGRGHVRSLIAAAGVIAAVGGVGWRIATRAPAPLPAALMVSRAPLDPLAYVAPSGTVAREVSRELPRWFGRADAPAIRIAGTARGATGRVHLSLAVPDPGIWTGRDVEVTSDGRFDFGPMRPGAYRVSATGAALDGWTLVDTRLAPADAIELALAPCEPRTFTVKDARAGVPIEDFTGQVIATTDAAGQFRACKSGDAGFRIAGELVGWGRLVYVNGGIIELDREPGATFTGKVVDADGAPAGIVGVQPVIGTGQFCIDAPHVVTTDALGRFAFTSPAPLCGVRIFRRDDAFEAPSLAPRDGALFPAPHPPPPPPPKPSLDERLSPVLQSYVVDPIEIRADGDGPLEWVVRLARPQAKYGRAFLERAQPVEEDAIAD